MITRMKHVTLVCLASDHEATLAALQALGVLHLTPITPPAGPDLEDARSARTHLVRTIEHLAAWSTKDTPAIQAANVDNMTALVSDIEGLLARKHEIAEEQGSCLEEFRDYEPFGDFEPSALEALSRADITVRLCRELVNDPLEIPEHAERVVLHDGRATRHIAVFARGPLPRLHGEMSPPTRSLGALRARLRQLDADAADVDTRLRAAAGHVSAMLAHVEALEDRIAFLEARAGMGSAPRVAYLQGYCPYDRVAAVESAAARHGWGILVSDPADDAAVPTLIRNPGWIKPIKSVFDVIGIEPGYREIDISAVFLLFFSIFFAMIIGDGGYGFLFLVATIYARRRLPRAPAYPFHLMGVLSVATILWGVLTGNFFGIQVLPPVLSALRVDWLMTEANLIRFCFLIGAVHLTIAHGWNAARVINSPQAIAQAGWIMITWSMYWLSANMILGSPLPAFFVPLLAAGVTAVVLFMTPPKRFKTEWYGHVMLPLDIIGNFVDLVSYLRLFAVGTAALAVAVNFNEMALARGFNGVLSGLIAALILVFGHVLNIVLGAMGVLVHGVRLNTLEFSRHVGMQWSGFKFAPFAKRAARAHEA
jgi:V/A-type H+-transporting ATPase subunit I